MRAPGMILCAISAATAMSLPDQKSSKGGCSTEIPNWIQRSLRRKGKSAFDDYDYGERIVGGRVALEPIPWQAHITIMIGNEPFQCGGTILDEETILSAAHCYKKKRLGQLE